MPFFHLLAQSLLGVLIGLLLGSLLGGGRAYVFGVAVGAGAAWLMSLWLDGSAPAEAKPAALDREQSPGGLPPAPRPANQPAEKVLSEEEARQWLDDFLRRQQSGSGRQ